MEIRRDIMKKRQAVLDKLNEVIEREVVLDNESVKMLNIFSHLEGVIEEMRRDVKGSADKVVEAEWTS